MPRRGRKRKRIVREADEGLVIEENASTRTHKINVGDPEATTAASASAAPEQASDGSSAVSSPVRRPYYKRAVIEVNSWGDETLEPLSNIDPAILDAYEEHEAKYNAKRRRHLKLITLELAPRFSCLGSPRSGSTRESMEETVLKTAKVVLGLSSYIDGNLLKRASGFLIDWDKESKTATVLTSALLIRTNSPSMDEWLAKDEFVPHAKVHVHLLDKNDTTVTAELVHYHRHYNFALFKIKMDLEAQIPSFNTEVQFDQEIFVLGRDVNRNLIVNRGGVVHKGPSGFERHHHMFIGCEVDECCLGGSVIDLDGQFLRMVTHPEMIMFISSAIILKCLHILKKHDYIPRLHTGMKFSAIKFLDPVVKEKLSRKCNIDAGLIVTEVSYGSVAEKVGIRIGDVVESWNGELISTTLELENFLLRKCEEHLDNGDGIDSNVETLVSLFLY
ncbi:hypothetical protein EJB05_33939, partial [Eragrostis curvula]